jgi:pantoate--beta-alanine ligase
MLHFSDIPPLRVWLAEQRLAGHRIGFVPTMGALHEGHLSLVDLARRRSDAVVMSVFVNPLQFGPAEDFQRYPRDLNRDQALAMDRGVTAIFTPSVEAMYPPGSEVRVVAGPMAERWEGAMRPGHFTGVLTVVTKLFHVVEPDVAVFGQKDIQQAALIRRMVGDLDFGLELIIAPTVRESDGLALSSRNAYLDSTQRSQALGLSTALRGAERLWRTGENTSSALESHMREQIRAFPDLVVDYIAIVDPEHLDPVDIATRGTIIAVAGRVGVTRLLDNHVLGTELR